MTERSRRHAKEIVRLVNDIETIIRQDSADKGGYMRLIEKVHHSLARRSMLVYDNWDEKDNSTD